MFGLNVDIVVENIEEELKENLYYMMVMMFLERKN